jgi:nitrite reductase/ring-hydroxylating ferredoxin subunit
MTARGTTTAKERSLAGDEAWLPHVGTYRRSLPVSLERLYENALDWEHLPWLHQSSFRDIECLEAGDWGWRARAGLRLSAARAEAVLELRLDRDSRRWITRTLEGTGKGVEIWTHAFALEEQQTDIVVDFFVPGIQRDDAGRMGEFYRELYARLYDEDVWMMSERQRQLDLAGRRESPPPVALGLLEEVRRRLPLLVDAAGRGFRVVEVDGRLLAHSTTCPHWLGPLDQCEVRDGAIQCPWHGYRFDVRTGKNLNGQPCRLSPAPRVRIDRRTSQVTLDFEPQASDRSTTIAL